ncbi:pyruvate kinase II [Gammaproteobacteria bacterium]
MPRRTKIVATLGPAVNDARMLECILRAGVDVVRINFSHECATEDYLALVERVRAIARAQDREIGVLADLQGPKLRIERFKEGKVELKEGNEFILDTSLAKNAGTEERVGLAYKEMTQDVTWGDILVLDDGRITLQVKAVEKSMIRTQVVVGGELSNNKGINRQGGGLSAPALTAKDRADIQTAANLRADYVAVSFPRSARDLEEARDLLRAAGGYGGIVAKVERAEALVVLEEIIAASDAVMIARGDLGVEIGDAELPGVQKRIISLARNMNKVVITATQMMESMIHSPIPTRAEVFDVANAVLDGTDAVMLSAETAIGRYPDKVVIAMDRICRGAEKQHLAMTSDYRVNQYFARIDEAIAMATMYTANHLGVTAIIALTESGSTPLWMSRISSGIPIYALTPHVETQRKITLYRGVYPIAFNISTTDHTRVNMEAVEELVRRGMVKDGDLAIITKGDLIGVQGGTNAMKIARVGSLVSPQQT